VETATLSHKRAAGCNGRSAVPAIVLVLPAYFKSLIVGIAIAVTTLIPRFYRFMRIRMLRRPRETCIDGVRLDCFEPGLEYELSGSLAALFFAEGWAEPLVPGGVPLGSLNQSGYAPTASDHQMQTLDSDRPSVWSLADPSSSTESSVSRNAERRSRSAPAIPKRRSSRRPSRTKN
jgi:hypothetical protein